MTDFLKNGMVCHGKLVRALVAGMLDANYVASSWLEGYEGVPFGRTCFFNAMNQTIAPLGGRMFCEKLTAFARHVMAHGADFEIVTKKVSCSPQEASAVAIDVIAPFVTPNKLVGLEALVVKADDDEGLIAKKADETAALLNLVLDSLDRDQKSTNIIVAKARMKEKVIEHLSELELCVERIPLSELTQALIESNKSALKSSGTYRLDAMVRGLVPGIIQEEREALFEYEGEASPLTQCVMSAWRDGRRSNLMLVGEGGIGKTVAMQEASLSLCKLGIPAVYIPLHMVPYLNVGRSLVKEYVASSVLKGDQGLFKNLDELTRSKHHDDRPNVVLLLDGWNEINEKKTPCGWLTDVMKEEIEAELSSLEGVQVVIAGRAKMDTFGMSRRRWSFFKVLRLERKNVGKYLSDNKVALPPVDDPVWDTLGNPLMLTLYTCSARQGAHCRENTCCSFIRGERSRSQSAIIWNFLQCQINKAMLVNRERGAAFSDLLAINYAAAYIGWSMERSGDFRISLRRLGNLINEAGVRYARFWEGSAFVANAKDATKSRVKDWDSGDIEAALLDGVGLLLGKSDEAPDKVMDENRVGFLHQKFRDFYAALLMKLEFDPYGVVESPEESEAWVGTAASHEVLNMLAGIMEESQITGLWEAMRGVKAKDDSFALFHLMEVAQRNDLDLAGLGFKGMDLRCTSLQDRGIASNGGLDFRGSWVSNKTLLPSGHAEYVIDVVWRPKEGGADGDQMISFGQSAVIWDARSGEPYAEVVHGSLGQYDAMAVSPDGEVVALSSEGEGFCLFSIEGRSKELVPMKGAPRVSTMAFAPNGKVLACGGEAGVQFLFDLASSSRVNLVMPPEISETYDWRSILEVCFSANGETLGVLYEGGAISMWRMSSDWLDMPPTLINATDIGDDIYEIQLSKDGSSVMVLTVYGEFLSSDVEKLLDWDDIELAVEGFDSIGFSYERNIAAAVCENEMMVLALDDGSIVKQFRMIADLNSALGDALRISISPSGDKAMCIHENNVITVWDTRPSFTVDERPLMAVENRRNGLGPIRIMADGNAACATALDYYLEWTPDCVVADQFCLVAVMPDYWDCRPDDGAFVQVFENSIGLYSGSREKLANFSFDNRFQGVRFAGGGKWVVALENTPGLVCLDGKTLEEAGSAILKDEVITMAPMPNGSVLGITDEGSLIEWALPGFEEVGRLDIWLCMRKSPDGETRALAERFLGSGGSCRIESPEHAQLECYQDEALGVDCALVVFEPRDPETDSDSQLVVRVDLDEESAFILDVDEEANETRGLAVMRDEGKFLLTSSQGWIESRSLETGEVLKSVEPIPNLNLIGVDFRGASFDNETLRDMVAASGGVL